MKPHYLTRDFDAEAKAEFRRRGLCACGNEREPPRTTCKWCYARNKKGYARHMAKRKEATK